VTYDTGAWVHHNNVAHVLCQVELRVHREVFVLVARADYFNNCLRNYRQRLILVRRLLAEYSYIGSLE